MANTNNLVNLIAGPSEAVVYFTLASDGTNESNLPIYDSSVIATALGIKDPKTSKLMGVYASVSAASTARVVLNFDATTPVLAMDLSIQGGPTEVSFDRFGGLPNQAGATGKTGDITLTTTGLASGDAITIILRVRMGE
jgi:hypothetical protein